MARYTYKHSNLWVENTNILDGEIEELSKWLLASKIDPDFDPDVHVYRDEDTGDVTLSLIELSNSQLFAATLILSSSELLFENKPVRFDKPPVTQKDLLDGTVC